MANEQPVGEGKEEPPPLGRSVARRPGIAPLLLGRRGGGDPPALGAMAEEPALGVAAARSTASSPEKAVASSPEKAAVSSREPCEARLRGAGFGNDAAAGIWG